MEYPLYLTACGICTANTDSAICEALVLSVIDYFFHTTRLSGQPRQLIMLTTPTRLACQLTRSLRFYAVGFRYQSAIANELISRAAFRGVLCTMIAHEWSKNAIKKSPFRKSAPHLGFFVCHGCCCVSAPVLLRLRCPTHHFAPAAVHTAALDQLSALYIHTLYQRRDISPESVLKYPYTQINILIIRHLHDDAKGI